MKTYAYHTTAFDETSEVEVKTNDVRHALHTLFEFAETGCETRVMDGYTCEIYVATNCDEPWCTDEWALMANGYLMELHWGE